MTKLREGFTSYSSADASCVAEILLGFLPKTKKIAADSPTRAVAKALARDTPKLLNGLQ